MSLSCGSSLLSPERIPKKQPGRQSAPLLIADKRTGLTGRDGRMSQPRSPGTRRAVKKKKISERCTQLFSSPQPSPASPRPGALPGASLHHAVVQVGQRAANRQHLFRGIIPIHLCCFLHGCLKMTAGMRGWERSRIPIPVVC